MQQDPLISVIVPIYRVDRYLERCVASITAQTYPNLEILLVDDGSPDGSGVICDAYQLTDSRIVAIHKPNGGVSSARNIGLDYANGSLVTFVDADDYIAPEMYEVLVRNLLVYEADLSICGFGNENPDGEFVRFCTDPDVRVLNREEQLECLISNRYFSCSCCDRLFRKERIGSIRFSEKTTHYEDLLFDWDTMKASNENGKAVFVSDPYYYYCTNEGSAATSRFNKKQMTMIDAYDRILADARSFSPSLYRTARKQFVRNNLMCAAHAVLGGYTDKADRKRLRGNVARNLFFFLRSDMAMGYKKQALLLTIGWSVFRLGL